VLSVSPQQWGIQGVVWGGNGCGTSLSGAPFIKIRPFLVTIEVETGKNALN